MSIRKIALIACCMGFVSADVLAGDFDSERLNNWHQWRGPEANGTAPLGDPPIHWGEDTNIKWKVEIPGSGSASPIVWGDQVFVLTAIKTDRTIEVAAEQRPQRGGRRGFSHGGSKPTNLYQFVVLSLDRETGKVRWKQIATEQVPHEGHQPTHGFASGSPTTDGQYLYASFGSRGIYCYDMEGNLQWSTDLGDMQSRLTFGEGTSPVLHGDSLIVNWDHEGQSFIVALDAKTGDEKWRTDRDEATSWATPLIVDHKGRTQIVTNATGLTRSYDFATGDLIWQSSGQTFNTIPSPVALDGVVYCMSGYRGKALKAISLDATGDITGADKIVWDYDRGTPYIPSPLLYGNLLYFVDANNAVLSVLDAETGEPHLDKVRIEGLRSLYASPVGAADRVYFIDRNGTTVVIKHGLELEVLATNTLDDSIDASPAIAGNQMFLRGAGHLYCVAAD